MPSHGRRGLVSKPICEAELRELVHELAKPDRAKTMVLARAVRECTPLPVVEPRRILLVEDNPTNQRVTQRLLEKLGHQVVVVGDGLQALEAIDATMFDLVLMDVQMPVMDGFAATARIREREATHGVRIPVVAMTANVMKGDRENCLSLRFDDYVAKPINRSCPQSIASSSHSGLS